MATQYTLLCDDEVAHEVRALSREYGLTEEEVLRQLVDLGLENLSDKAVA